MDRPKVGKKTILKQLEKRAITGKAPRLHKEIQAYQDSNTKLAREAANYNATQSRAKAYHDAGYEEMGKEMFKKKVILWDDIIPLKEDWNRDRNRVHSQVNFDIVKQVWPFYRQWTPQGLLDIALNPDGRRVQFADVSQDVWPHHPEVDYADYLSEENITDEEIADMFRERKTEYVWDDWITKDHNLIHNEFQRHGRGYDSEQRRQDDLAILRGITPGDLD